MIIYIYEQNWTLADFESFTSKVKLTGNTPNSGGREDVEIVVPWIFFKIL